MKHQRRRHLRRHPTCHRKVVRPSLIIPETFRPPIPARSRISHWPEKYQPHRSRVRHRIGSCLGRHGIRNRCPSRHMPSSRRALDHNLRRIDTQLCCMILNPTHRRTSVGDTILRLGIKPIAGPVVGSHSHQTVFRRPLRIGDTPGRCPTGPASTEKGDQTGSLVGRFPILRFCYMKA